MGESGKLIVLRGLWCANGGVGKPAPLFRQTVLCAISSLIVARVRSVAVSIGAGVCVGDVKAINVVSIL